MLVLLPDAMDGLGGGRGEASAAENVTPLDDAASRRQDVLVFLPRFSVESGFGLGTDARRDGNAAGRSRTAPTSPA